MKIYVAHEYGRKHGLSDEECELNVTSCIENFVRPLILMGHNPFTPLLWHYIHKGWDESPGEPRYFNLVAEWIEKCDSFLLAKLPTWPNSGVLRERGIADKLKMPIYYNLNEIRRVAPTGGQMYRQLSGGTRR